jgi:carboxymethylenebutenolidase
LKAEDIVIETADGTCDAVLFREEDGPRLPGVVFLTDIGGIRPSQRDKAMELAMAGYTVLMPNLFYRTGRPPLLDFPVTWGDEKVAKRIQEMRGPLDMAALERDGAAYVDALAASGAATDAQFGVVGYCFSGKGALAAAAVRPDRVGAAASFHGGHLVTDDPSSPHLLLPRITASLYFGHAKEDQSMPASAIATLDAALAAWGGSYESETYDAHHSWTEPDSPVYDPVQAKRAYDKLLGLLAKNLV